jgi:casein kinase 1
MELHNGVFTIDDFTPTGIIGTGSYGSVYVGTHHLIATTKRVAVKLHTDKFLLDREVQIYQYLWKYIKQGHSPGLRIPRLLWNGSTDSGTHEALVMERLGHSLDRLFDASNKRWSVATVCWVACEALQLLQGLHALGIVHRDIKPDNFAIGYDGAKRTQLHIFDFGLSSQYIAQDGTHSPVKEGVSLIGTMRYASVHNHDGVRQSRRDDLEALFYVLMYFANGTLAWKAAAGIADRAEKSAAMRQSKVALTAADVPEALRGFFAYVKGLGYTDTPCYDEWIAVFRESSHADSQLPDWLYYYANADTKTIFQNRPTKTRKKH